MGFAAFVRTLAMPRSLKWLMHCPKGCATMMGVPGVVHSPAHERLCSFAGMTPLRVEEGYEDDA